MPLSISKKQLNRIGDAIAQTSTPERADLNQLNDILLEYQAILDLVERELSGLGYSATTRVKTLDVLIEKLQREQGMKLARVQDLAGARIVIDGGRIDQDKVVETIRVHFEHLTNATSKVIDRRLVPSHGYRAVHVVINFDDVPVEVQVRTNLQNLWAQAVENVARTWGRGIRYGQPPNDPNKVVGRKSNGQALTRSNIMNTLTLGSEVINKIETNAVVIETSRDQMNHAISTMIQASRQIDETIDDDSADLYKLARGTLISAINMFDMDRRRRGRIIRKCLPKDPLGRRRVDFNGFADELAILVDHSNEDTADFVRRSETSISATLGRLASFAEQGSRL